MAMRLGDLLRCALTIGLYLTWISSNPAVAQADGKPFEGRSVLYGEIASDEFRGLINRIVDPESDVVPDRKLLDSGYYFRLSPRAYVIDQDGALKDGALLGGKPYVFLTVPTAAFGRSLYDIYADIGYSAEDLLGQRGVPTVAMVFRYGEQISLSQARDGALTPDFRSFVYVPTWRNAFALFAALAAESPRTDTSRLLHLNLDDHERDLAQFFPVERLDRITAMPFALIRSVGGPDWVYRSLLVREMGMNAHFLGSGKTENTLSPADTRKGLPEFVGPNRIIAQLPEAAVIDMGRLEFVEVHD